jgi:hypothetical protein
MVLGGRCPAGSLGACDMTIYVTVRWWVLAYAIALALLMVACHAG